MLVALSVVVVSSSVLDELVIVPLVVPELVECELVVFSEVLPLLPFIVPPVEPLVDHVESLLFVFEDVLLLTVPVPAIEAVLSVVPLTLVPLVPLTLVELL